MSNNTYYSSTKGRVRVMSRPTLSFTVDRHNKPQVWLRGATLMPDVMLYLSKCDLPDTLVILFGNGAIVSVAKTDLERSYPSNGYYERLFIPVAYLKAIDKVPEETIFYI